MSGMKGVCGYGHVGKWVQIKRSDGKVWTGWVEGETSMFLSLQLIPPEDGNLDLNDNVIVDREKVRVIEGMDIETIDALIDVALDLYDEEWFLRLLAKRRVMEHVG
ncbi:hypothetical protein D3C74_55430 [compost metagenome]